MPFFFNFEIEHAKRSRIIYQKTDKIIQEIFENSEKILEIFISEQNLNKTYDGVSEGVVWNRSGEMETTHNMNYDYSPCKKIYRKISTVF